MAEISRRTLLNRAMLTTALGGGALLGVTRPIRHRVATPPPPPPAALTAALSRQQHLLAGYDQALARQRAHPGLAALRADLAAHGAALREVLQRYPGWRLAVAAGSAEASAGTAAPTGDPTLDPIGALATASRSGAAATRAACLAWPATEAHAAEVVPLLGSIAACLASHAQVLG